MKMEYYVYPVPFPPLQYFTLSLYIIENIALRFCLLLDMCRTTLIKPAVFVLGKWQYEVNLGTNGVMQIGWATSTCKFSQEIGVGKFNRSFIERAFNLILENKS